MVVNNKQNKTKQNKTKQTRKQGTKQENKQQTKKTRKTKQKQKTKTDKKQTNKLQSLVGTSERCSEQRRGETATCGNKYHRPQNIVKNKESVHPPTEGDRL